jgi:hypothetical protein
MTTSFGATPRQDRVHSRPGDRGRIGSRSGLVPALRSADRTQSGLLAQAALAVGDPVVIVAGAPPHAIGVTDLLRVRRLGDDDRSSTGLITDGNGVFTR